MEEVDVSLRYVIIALDVSIQRCLLSLFGQSSSIFFGSSRECEYVYFESHFPLIKIFTAEIFNTHSKLVRPNMADIAVNVSRGD